MSQCSLTEEERAVYKENHKLLKAMGVSRIRIELDLGSKKNILTVDEIAERLTKVYPELTIEQAKTKVGDIVNKEYVTFKYCNHVYKFQKCPSEDNKERYTLYCSRTDWVL